MNILIDGKKINIVTTDSKYISLKKKGQTTTLYAPTDIDIHTLEQYVAHTQLKDIDNEKEQELEYLSKPIQIFQQDYLIKIIKNSPYDKVQMKNRTVSIYTKKGKSIQKQLEEWRTQFVIQQLNDHISYWEESLQVLVGEIKMRSMKKSLYRIQNDKQINFGFQISDLTLNELKFISFQAVAELINLPTNERKQYYPQVKEALKQISYSLKTCQTLS